MPFEFRPAKRERVSLLIGLSGGTGSGKTYSAFRLAKGIAGDAPFVCLDTEAGRANHYADEFRFDHGDVHPPFSPETYTAAIKAADEAKYPVIIVDSMSHEWAGEGGILDQHEAELDRMAGTDWKKREASKMAAWIKPKMAHKQMVTRLLQIRAHVILCFRAEAKVEMRRGEGNRWEIVPKESLTGLHGWIPISEKNLPYELTASFLLMADRPGVPHPIKLQQQHREFFPLDQPINETSGARLGAWAAGAPASDQSWAARLAAARTRDELEIVGRALMAARDSMPPGVLDTLRAAYGERLKKLHGPTKAKAKPPTATEMTAPAVDDIRWSTEGGNE